MTVALLPPTTSSLGRIDGEPLTEGPRFIRTQGMSRWHRPRNGVRYTAADRTVYTAWCGYGIGGSERAGRFLSLEALPDGDQVCATCDGRAVGAGQETVGPAGRKLAFGPREHTRPRWCPGSRTALYQELPGGTAGRCLACQDTHPLRAMGGPYNPRYAIVQHPPGQGLVAPCPFHRWRYPTAQDGGLACSCGRPLTHTTAAERTRA